MCKFPVECAYTVCCICAQVNLLKFSRAKKKRDWYMVISPCSGRAQILELVLRSLRLHLQKSSAGLPAAADDRHCGVEAAIRTHYISK